MIPTDADEELITENYCKMEYFSSIFSHVGIVAAQLIIYFIAFLFPNAYGLPFNFYIILFPLDRFTFAWHLNYLLIVTWHIFALSFFVVYFSFPAILMNHSCWLIELATLTAKKMNASLKLQDNLHDAFFVENSVDIFKKLVERCEKIVKWQNEVQDLLSWNFNFEFQIQSLVFCLLIFVLSLDFFGSYYILSILIVCVMQLFVVCWMGTRTKSRLHQLSYEIGKNWYLMQPKQRKDLQMIVHWTQNIKGFSGTFKDVDLNTFKSVCKLCELLQINFAFLYFSDIGSVFFILRSIAILEPSLILCYERINVNKRCF